MIDRLRQKSVNYIISIVKIFFPTFPELLNTRVLSLKIILTFVVALIMIFILRKSHTARTIFINKKKRIIIN